MGQLGKFELNSIVHGDCLDVMREMPDGCVDAIVTDPPYQVGLNKALCAWDVWPCADIWKETYRVTKDSALLVFCIAPHVAHERVPDVLGAGWYVLEVGFWVYGAGRPVAKTRLKRCYDLVYFLTKSNRHLFTEQSRGAYKANTITGRRGTIHPKKGKLGRQFHRCESRRPYVCNENDYHPANVACEIGSLAFGASGYDLIFAVKRRLPVNQAQGKHPTGKPIELIAQQVKLVSNLGDLVFDPFMGSGTTALVAAKLDRDFFGCDNNPEYVKMANNRVERYMEKYGLKLF